MKYEDLVSLLAKAIADCVVGKNGESEADAARSFLKALSQSKFAIVPSNASDEVCRAVAPSMWKGMTQQEAAKVASQIYLEMVRDENLLGRKRGLS